MQRAKNKTKRKTGRVGKECWCERDKGLARADEMAAAGRASVPVALWYMFDAITLLMDANVAAVAKYNLVALLRLGLDKKERWGVFK
jgi:hypothetical protein